MKRFFRVLPVLIGIAAFAAVFAVVLSGIGDAKSSAAQQELTAIRDSLYKAAVTCYAMEGQYPPTYEYLMDNYNLQVSTDKYTIFYEIFASNIMPDITVIPN